MPILVPIIAAIAPFALWLVELLLPFPHVIEEVAKGFLIFSITEERSRTAQIKLTLLSALIFSFSETILYIFNIVQVGDISTLLTRLVLTTILHGLTMFLMLIITFRGKRFLLLGVVLAMLIHYLFNLMIASL